MMQIPGPYKFYLLLVFNHRHAALAGQRRWVNLGIPGIVLLVMVVFSPGDYYGLHARYYPGERLLFYKEGVSATISVHEQQTGHLALAINGSKTAFTNNDDLRVHKMLAYLPYVFNPEARSACIIGFGMGVTAATLTSLDLEEVRTADISPELLETSVFSQLIMTLSRSIQSFFLSRKMAVAIC